MESERKSTSSDDPVTYDIEGKHNRSSGNNDATGHNLNISLGKVGTPEDDGMFSRKTTSFHRGEAAVCWGLFLTLQRNLELKEEVNNGNI